jgi:hypothetical protein
LRTATPIFTIAVIARPGFVAYSATHQLITRFAVTALTTNPLKTGFEHSVNVLDEPSIEPDSVLRPTLGTAESRRHYVDFEYFGSGPFSNLNPEFSAMKRRFGTGELEHTRAGFDLDFRGSSGGQPQRLPAKRTAASLRRRNTS